MFGSGIGDLKVYIKDLETDFIKKIWEKQGDQGDKWFKGTADITSYTNYKVIHLAETKGK
jgi:hypothetical protein